MSTPPPVIVTFSARAISILVGVLLALGLFGAALAVTLTHPNVVSVDCGSWLSPRVSNAQVDAFVDQAGNTTSLSDYTASLGMARDGYVLVAECEHAQREDRAWALSLGSLGLAAIVGTVGFSLISRRPRT